jgi:hypothetical protein
MLGAETAGAKRRSRALRMDDGMRNVVAKAYLLGVRHILSFAHTGLLQMGVSLLVVDSLTRLHVPQFHLSMTASSPLSTFPPTGLHNYPSC